MLIVPFCRSSKLDILFLRGRVWCIFPTRFTSSPFTTFLDPFTLNPRSFAPHNLYLETIFYVIEMDFHNLSVTFGLPSQELFSWSPKDAPQTILPRPQGVPKWIQPFEIHPTLFHFFLEPKVPITIAAVYLVSVIYLNRLNELRQNRPWNFAKTWAFKALVICHNIFLALFSALTFYGVCHMLWHCWPQKTESNFLAHVADSLCRINGPTGPDPTREFLIDTDISIQFQSTRLWNNGYAYFSWIFYMSKFYEVVDTMIILAKGKRTSILQMYHHAGVMVCAWSGVRYMSPPGIVGIFLNSGIHTLMVHVLHLEIDIKLLIFISSIHTIL